jgi:hypothetical protein
MTTKVDDSGKSIRENLEGLIRIDGIPAFRKVIKDGKTYLQFQDADRVRIQCRGTKLVEVPLDVLVKFLNDD